MPDPVTIAMGVGAAAGGIVQGVGSLIGGNQQVKSNEKMNRENLKLAYVQRDDQLAKDQRDEAQRAAEFRFNRRLSLTDRAYQSRKDQREWALQQLNNNMALQQAMINMRSGLQRRR